MEEAARKQLIEQLKPFVHEPEFDKIFAMLTADMPGPKRFQLKSELRSLAAPCNRQIDLRKRVDGEVQPYEHKGHIHYLDALAISIFEDGLERYHGVFTQDTYDRIMNAENNYRVMAEREKKQLLAAKIREERLNDGKSNTAPAAEQPAEANTPSSNALAVPYFSFGRYVTRREERMNYAGAVELGIGEHKIPAITSDISLSGICVRLKMDAVAVRALNLAEGNKVTVLFTAFTKDFTLDINHGVGYTLVGIDRRAKGTYLRLKRNSDEAYDDFDAFLSRFISGYKHRYKVNVDNIVEAVASKAHEQLYLPRMVSVPLFFKRAEKRMFPYLALEAEMNGNILDAWTNESNSCVVGGMFSGARLSRLLAALKTNPKGVAEVVVYSFQLLRNGRSHFYSATQNELQNPETKRVFLGYASRRAHFKVYRFTLAKLDIGKAWIPSTLPKDVAEREGMVQRPPSPVVMKELGGLTHIGVLTDITPDPRVYHGYEFEKEELPQLNAFAHPTRGLKPLRRAPLNYVNVRSESRFNYRSQVRVSADGESQLGVLRDFSTLGMQVEVERPMNIQKGTVVDIDLLQFAKSHASFDLKKLPYRVMHASPDRTVMHLKVEKKGAEHNGQNFFSHLIHNHAKALKMAEQTGTQHGLQLCLRNLYCNALMSLPLFIKKPKGDVTELHRVGVSLLDEPVKTSCMAFSRGSKLNLTPILDEDFMNGSLFKYAKAMNEQSRPWSTIVLVTRWVEKGKLRVRRLRLTDATDPALAKEFIQIGMERGEVSALRYIMVGTGKPDTEFVANEFRYLNEYAPHRAEAIEAEIWSNIAIVDVVPVTDEVMFRLGISTASS